VQEKFTRNGSRYGLLKMEDFTGSADIFLYGTKYVTYRNYCQTGWYLFIRGRIGHRRWHDDDSCEFQVASISLLEEEKNKLIQSLSITLPIRDMSESVIDELSPLIKNHPGKSLLRFRLTDADNNLDLLLSPKQTCINVTPELINYLEGNEHLTFRINER